MKNVFSVRLQNAMDKYGMNQTDVIRASEPYCRSHDVKLTKSALSQYLSGSKTPKYDKLKIFEYVFEISSDWFAGFTDDPNINYHNQNNDIVSLYGLLNNEGKQKVIDYIADLVENPKYRKEEE